jgi:hypothetical protein
LGFAAGGVLSSTRSMVSESVMIGGGSPNRARQSSATSLGRGNGPWNMLLRLFTPSPRDIDSQNKRATAMFPAVKVFVWKTEI